MKPHNKSPLLKPLYLLLLALTGGFLIYTYGLHFNNYSETELVNMSYIWIPIVSFSLAGLRNIKKEYSLRWAFAGAISSFILLITFFEILWPLL